jgi:hypothetical protein
MLIATGKPAVPPTASMVSNVYGHPAIRVAPGTVRINDHDFELPVGKTVAVESGEIAVPPVNNTDRPKSWDELSPLEKSWLPVPRAFLKKT